ncbi:MAG: DUF5695 domain-containing protein [Candidatus Bipolaricaulia bacterium]
MQLSFPQRVLRGVVGLLALHVFLLGSTVLYAQEDDEEDITPTLGLDQGVIQLETPNFNLELVEASQTVSALRPKSAGGFDFTPHDWLDRRNGDGFFHLGDLTLRLRTGTSGGWAEYSTAADRAPVEALDASGSVLAAANLAPTLPDDIPLSVRRDWAVEEGNLVLRFELENQTDQTVEIGALGIPMVFNNILTDRSLKEAHATNSFYDPYIGQDAGYLQVTRLNGHGPALVVAPEENTPFEAYRPLLSDPTNRGITFEGFYEWTVHSKAYAQNEWSSATLWNPPTAATLAPGEQRTYAVQFLVSESIRQIEETLIANDRPVAVGVPGYVLPKNQRGQLFLKHESDVQSMEVTPEGALKLEEGEGTENGWQRYRVHGQDWGRARLTVIYQDGTEQSVNYKVIKPETQVLDDLGEFLTTEQWYNPSDDPFNRSPSVISYDYGEDRQVTQEGRAWIAGLSDEGGAGSWLAAIMKQLVRPDPQEIDKLERFVDETVWGGIQYSEGEEKYAVRKSLFYYEPDEMPEGTYVDSIEFGGWTSWDQEEARSVGRSYNYPHVAAAYWVLYRLARNHDGLVTDHSWQWYLRRAQKTGEAMVEHAPAYAEFGQMEGTVFLRILRDMQHEGWTLRAQSFETTMRGRAEIWEKKAFPFGSEMPWDSTGQEEVYAWCRYFGFDQKATVTLRAILGYMPTVPHWGYNGSARRYWDFIYAGKLQRIERQLHHYGSGLNSIPVLSEYRRNPDDAYLLRVGYGGVMGAISNITQEGFAPSAFHSYPSTLRIDHYSGDNGPGIFGHAVNTGTYLMDHSEFGWLAFGGDRTVDGNQVTVKPLDSSRSRVYLAPLGLWLRLEAGTFEEVSYNSSTGDVQVTLSSTTQYTPTARLRIDQPASVDEVGSISPSGEFSEERGAYVVPLDDSPTQLTLETRN